jgi:hypothetical protein
MATRAEDASHEEDTMTASQPVPAGTLYRRRSAPAEEYVVLADGISPGDEYAAVRYFGGQGNTWAEPVENLAAPAFRAVAF